MSSSAAFSTLSNDTLAPPPGGVLPLLPPVTATNVVTTVGQAIKVVVQALKDGTVSADEFDAIIAAMANVAEVTQEVIETPAVKSCMSKLCCKDAGGVTAPVVIPAARSPSAAGVRGIPRKRLVGAGSRPARRITIVPHQ